MPVTTRKNGATTKGSTEAPVIELRPLKIETVDIPIVGTAELIVHAWGEKAKRQMLEKQMNPGTRPKKEPKDPVADYEASFYRLEDGSPGFPATGLKKAIVGACRLFDGLPMTQARIAIRVLGEGQLQLVRIQGEPYMREDMVRLETGVADLRYRAGFPEWEALLRIKFNAALLSLNSLVNLVDGAGQGGIGEWRPEKSPSGSFGTFEVKRDAL